MIIYFIHCRIGISTHGSPILDEFAASQIGNPLDLGDKSNFHQQTEGVHIFNKVSKNPFAIIFHDCKRHRGGYGHVDDH